MTRGFSLEKDLRLLINNPKYSDIEILCEDEKKLYGCRAILAARSEVFNGLLYNGMKESYETKISFPEINSTGMEIVLEYIYTGSIKDESLTKDNIIEAFHAADYFQLPDLQDFISAILAAKQVSNNACKALIERLPPLEQTENSVQVENKIIVDHQKIAKELEPLIEYIDFRRIKRAQIDFIEPLKVIPAEIIQHNTELIDSDLNNIRGIPIYIFSRLSITGLQYLLSCTFEKEKPFVTPEYELFRYSAILAAKQVSNDAFDTLLKRLPTLDQIEN
ncbi:BTB/POZ protein [Rhizophagus diaphanus]|nr:BTB/POZ protein [Rhizophagus diaphanus] [Rhizophagus sp. MUCL 43196]